MRNKMKGSLTVFLTFMTGTAIGMMAGYFAGTRKQVYLDTRVLENMSRKKADFNKAIEKDLENMKKDYKSKLRELSKAIDSRP